MDDVNEIFRIMHTIKGSSAMMEFSSLMKIAHKTEDLFYIIRDKGVETFDAVCSEAEHHELFNLVFNTIDFMRSEIEKIENDEPLTDNIDQELEKISNFIDKINTHFGNTQNSDSKENANTEQAAESTEKEQPKEQTKAANEELPDISPFFLKVFFDDGCGMENLRAFMLVTAIKDVCSDFTFYPKDIETNSETAHQIIDNGFLIGFKSKDDLDKSVAVLKGQSNIYTYEIIENEQPVKEEKSTPADAVKKEGAK